MQNPGIVDWRLSPGSFASTPQVLIGEDGAETFAPATFATSTFHLRQVVRQADQPKLGGYVQAQVLEYAVSIVPIGHSLGQVLYSLPLAPGESIRLAVIDWRREEAGGKSEQTAASERLMHEQTRDRTISEIVNATLQEWQRGGSIMGGHAGGAGASGQLGMFSLAGGGMSSIGGAYSTSSGTRELAADTMQRVTDAVHQTSSLFREQTTSVVVQTQATERQAIETRAFANHNRGHSMTVMYYEVLRHFRIVTEFTRKQQAVLVPRKGWDLNNNKLLLHKRRVLRPVLLDSAYGSGFDALLKLETIRLGKGRYMPPAPATHWDGNIEFKSFFIRIRVGDEGTEDVVQITAAHVNGVTTYPLEYVGNTNFNSDKSLDHEGDHFFPTEPIKGGPIAWRNLRHITINKPGEDDLRIVEIDIWGESSAGRRLIHDHRRGGTYPLTKGKTTVDLTVDFPPPEPPEPVNLTAEQELPAEDYAAIQHLKDHINLEADYYRRALDMSESPNAYAVAFQNKAWDGGDSLEIDHIVPAPLEVLGSFIAFPLVDQGEGLQEEDEQELDADPPPKTERLMSLPTRGLFAEAKLGHSNVAEEIDETRFWRWDEHPLPFLASEIAAVQPVQPKPADVDLTSKAVPEAALGIQAAPNAPDPTGLAEAIKAIVTADAFRDMSGRQELKELLGDLIEGAVKMAEAASKGREIQSKMNTDLDRQRREGDVGMAHGSNELERIRSEERRQQPQQVKPSDAAHAIQVIDGQVRKGKLPKEEGDRLTQTTLENMPGSKPPTPRPSGTGALQKSQLLKMSFRYSHSKQAFDGEFRVTISGPGAYELEDAQTSGGQAEIRISKLPPGNYPITLVGVRTRPPENAPASVLIPKLGDLPEREVSVNQQLFKSGTTISGTGSFRVGPGSEFPVLEVEVQEAVTEATKEFSRTTGEGDQLELGTEINAAAGWKDIVEVGVTTSGKKTWIEEVGQGETYSLKIPITYLTGGLTISTK